MEVLIVSKAEIFAAAGKWRPTHLVSISDPPGDAPLPWLPDGHTLRLLMSDVRLATDPVTEREVKPTEAHVEAIVAFGRTLSRDARVLLHCHAGISRSPAVALILIAAVFESDIEELQAVTEQVVKAHPHIAPNPYLLHLGARVLPETLLAESVMHAHLPKVEPGKLLLPFGVKK